MKATKKTTIIEKTMTKIADAKKATAVKQTKAAAPAAEPKAKAAAKPEAPAAEELKIHINPSGRICFGKTAAARLTGCSYIQAAADGKAITLTGMAKQADGAVAICYASGRPYIGGMKLLKPMGFSGEKGLDLIAKATGDHGFKLSIG